jgi:hypothetical protein
MKKIALFLFGIYSITRLSAQDFPSLNMKEQQIIFPAFISGMLRDTSAKLSGDTFIYRLRSQWFIDQPLPLGKKESPGRSTPFETMNELVIAYATKNAGRIVELYRPDARKKISELLTRDQKEEVLNYFAGAKNVVLLAILQIQNGYLIYTRDDIYGVHENYLTLYQGKYYATPLDNHRSATRWNIGLYLKFLPKPFFELPLFTFPDSISITDSLKIECSLPAGYHIQMFHESPGQLIPYRIEDNGPQDLAAEAGKILFYMSADGFPVVDGKYSFYLTSSNFPVAKISPSLLRKGRKYTLKKY